MNEKLVYVLTNADLGWDCVCGVFTKKEDILDYLNEGNEPDDECYFHTLDDLDNSSYVISEEFLHE